MGDREKIVTILHFNDVYNIEPGSRDPVGGAARLAWQVKSHSAANPLVLFSGDAFNPSIMSTLTLGKHMVPVLNACGVHASVVGNHDTDWGVSNMARLCAECDFPWLMANVIDKQTGEPLGGVGSTTLLDWPCQGGSVKVGIMGLVEGEWIQTLAAVDPATLEYRDFVAEGRRLAGELKAAGAELVVALTHMRLPNDQLLAAAVPEIDLVLGGHDHCYYAEQQQPSANWVVKSGTDFRDLSLLRVQLQGGARPRVACCERQSITSAVPEDPQTAQVVAEFAGLMGERMQEVMGASATELDGRFEAVRTRESNLGNLVCDVFRMATGAEAALINSGSLRSDQLHPAGPLTFKDFVSILPMIDMTIVVEARGEQLLGALENSVSQLPKQEGRFAQVSGISFKFDSSKPAGQRVLRDSVTVGGAPLELGRGYRLATKAYLTEGKDGYDCLKGCKELVPADLSPSLPTIVRNHFLKLSVLNAMHPAVKAGPFAHHWRRSLAPLQDLSERRLDNGEPEAGVCIEDPVSHKFVVAPVCDGRIVDVSAA